MNLHKIISNMILNILTYYIDKKIYINIFRIEYLIYIQYYFIYNIINNFISNLILNNIFYLNIFYINDLLCEKLIIKYNYISLEKYTYINSINYIVLFYLTFMKVILYNKYMISTIYIFLISIFYILYLINYTYKKRLLSINNNSEFIEPLKFLIITSNKNIICNIVDKTKFFTFTNFIFYLNILNYLLFSK